jgi:hypothetical protein
MGLLIALGAFIFAGKMWFENLLFEELIIVIADVKKPKYKFKRYL